ncbi:MAG: hypothetical protein RIA08_09790 [Roseovarius sp.]|uniref:hypothetical protein n=1 Tax=Roseovarius sp. TaxID=1486281 RepID=UPI0032EAD3DF
MVQGLARFERRWKAIPKAVREAVTDTLEQNAKELVAEMNRVKPLDDIEVGWTWGKPPKGSVAVAKSAKTSLGVAITVWARAKPGSGFNAGWFEFGTSERQQKSGKSTGAITAQPFFYPIYRARRRRGKSRLTRNVNKAIKRL